MQDVCFEILASFLRYITTIFLYFWQNSHCNKSRAHELNKWLFVSASRRCSGCLQPVVNMEVKYPISLQDTTDLSSFKTGNEKMQLVLKHCRKTSWISAVVRFTTHVQTHLVTDQVVAGCEKLSHKVESTLYLSQQKSVQGARFTVDCEQSLIFLCEVTARETQARER